MPPPHTVWAESDLERLIDDGVKEGVELDYKRSAALANTDRAKDEISKDISAFANSGGGTIVYGVSENGHVPTRIDSDLVPGGLIGKEWLENVIRSRIRPVIDGITIHEVELHRTRPGHVAYVVDVPQSLRAPHQASDLRYYKRHNFSCEPMHDYEVRDVLRRAEAPALSVRLQLQPRDPFPYASGELLVLIENESDQPAEYVLATVGVDARMNPRAWTGFTKVGSSETVGPPFAVLVEQHRSIWGRERNMPVFRGVLAETGRILVALPQSSARFLIQWSLRCPRMMPQAGYALAVIERGPTEFGINFQTLGADVSRELLDEIRDTQHFPNAPSPPVVRNES